MIDRIAVVSPAGDSSLSYQRCGLVELRFDDQALDRSSVVARATILSHLLDLEWPSTHTHTYIYIYTYIALYNYN